MATRTVRLDDETERALDEVRAATGLPISEVLKSGVKALQREIRQSAPRRAYDIYRSLKLGPGGDSVSSSDDVRSGLDRVLRRKHRR